MYAHIQQDKLHLIIINSFSHVPQFFFQLNVTPPKETTQGAVPKVSVCYNALLKFIIEKWTGTSNCSPLFIPLLSCSGRMMWLLQNHCTLCILVFSNVIGKACLILMVVWSIWGILVILMQLFRWWIHWVIFCQNELVCCWLTHLFILILQALFHVPLFVHWLRGHAKCGHLTCTTCELVTLLNNLSNEKVQTIRPVLLLSVFKGNLILFMLSWIRSEYFYICSVFKIVAYYSPRSTSDERESGRCWRVPGKTFGSVGVWIYSTQQNWNEKVAVTWSVDMYILSNLIFTLSFPSDWITLHSLQLLTTEYLWAGQKLKVSINHFNLWMDFFFNVMFYPQIFARTVSTSLQHMIRSLTC